MRIIFAIFGNVFPICYPYYTADNGEETRDGERHLLISGAVSP